MARVLEIDFYASREEHVEESKRKLRGLQEKNTNSGALNLISWGDTPGTCTLTGTSVILNTHLNSKITPVCHLALTFCSSAKCLPALLCERGRWRRKERQTWRRNCASQSMNNGHSRGCGIICAHPPQGPQPGGKSRLGTSTMGLLRPSRGGQGE